MYEVILRLLLSLAVLAIPPVPSKVLTITGSSSSVVTGTVVTSQEIESGILFDGEEDVLASIRTESYNGFTLCGVTMTTVVSPGEAENSY